MGKVPTKPRRSSRLRRRRKFYEPEYKTFRVRVKYDRDSFAKLLGGKTVRLLDKDVKIVRVSYAPRMRKEVLSRMIDRPKRILKADKAINRIFRAAHKSQDELFSTALTREFIKGFFEKRGIGTLSSDELDHLVKLVDTISSVRIPTEYSGFATKDAVMQHPANRARAVFADPYDTASLHSEMDSRRRDYVEQAMERALEGGAKNAQEVVVAGARAAIEFTLNYFTAPITADNVFKFTRSSAKPKTDKRLQEQLASRERMKKRYEELGGSLRRLEIPETPQQSWDRPWQSGLREGEVLVAPPSPRRQPAGFSFDE